MFYRCVVHVVALVLAVLAAPGHRLSAQFAGPDAPAAAGPTAPSPAGSPVRLDGTVLHTDGAVTLVFVDGRVVRVHPTVFVTLQAGDRVTVTGTAMPRGPDRDVVNATVARHGSGSLPQPRRVSVAELAADDGADSWVEFEGVVREQNTRPADVELRIGGGLLGSITIVVPPLESALHESLIDAVVRIRAVRQVQRNPQGMLTGIRIVAARLTARDIVEAAGASVADLPVHPLAQGRDIALQRLSERRMRV